MDKRHDQILSAVVNEYITTARPVGSSFLSGFLELGIGSATIRAILRDLEESGYLLQPHTSAGRIPTDKGYRYYVDKIRGGKHKKNLQKQLKDNFNKYVKEYEQMQRGAVKALSKMAHTIAVSGLVDSGNIQETGLHELLEQPEGDSHEAMKEMSAVLNAVEDSLPQLKREAKSEATVFIGNEMPFFPAKHTSLVVKTIPWGDDQLALILIGPKRMPYQRNLSLVDHLAEIIEDL